ncbi:MAG: tetratricopeptide repeat protein, partial [Ginsengibacter sp.]
ISNQSGIYDFFDNDFIKAETLARESIAWYEKTSNKKGIESVDENLSFALFSQSKYDEVSMIALNKYAVGKKNNDQLKMCDALQGLAVIQFQKGNYDSAFYFSQQAQQIAITNKNSERISSILYGFGTLYREIGDYQTAINNYRTVFQNDTHETIQSRIDGSYETWARMEFAELFSLTGQFDSAWHYYHLFDTTKITDKDLRVYLVSTGETYLLQKNYTKALQNFLRGLVMHRKLNDRNEIKRVLLDIAKTYFALGNNRAVLQYVQEGLGIAIQTKSRQFIRDGYEILYLVYDRLHNIDSAYYYFKKYIATKETVVSGQTKGKYAAYKYEEEINSMNNEKLIARQRLKIQQQQLSQAAFQKKILVLGIFGLILIAGVLFRVIILKRNNEKHQRE